MSASQIILPTAYLPPINWWVLALHFKSIVIELCETYPKQSYRNRCHIYSANGMQSLSIPVIRSEGNHTPTSKILIDYSKSWQMNHWRALEAAYSRTPYYLFYRDYFYPFFSQRTETLHEYNQQLIRLLLSLLKLNIDIAVSEDYVKLDPSDDYRLLIHPKKDPSATGIQQYSRYIQAFETKFGFLANLSVIDLLFHEGPAASVYLRQLEQTNLQIRL